MTACLWRKSTHHGPLPVTSALPSLSLSLLPAVLFLVFIAGGGRPASPGGVERVSEQLLEGTGDAPGLRFGETAVETNTWLAFAKR